MRIEFVDLSDRRTQILEFFCSLARVKAQRIEAPLDLDRLSECRAILLQERAVLRAPELIERAALGGLARESDLVSLAVNRHHRPDNIRQGRGGNGP